MAVKVILRLTVLLVTIGLHVTMAQTKLPLDTAVLSHWPKVQDGQLSDDGRYLSYTIREVPRNRQTVVVRSADGRWERRFKNGTKWQFCSDSRHGLLTHGDSLTIMKLGTANIFGVVGAAGGQLIRHGKEDRWCFIDANHNLFLLDPTTGHSVTFKDINRYQFSADRGRLYMEQKGMLYVKRWKDATLRPVSQIGQSQEWRMSEDGRLIVVRTTANRCLVYDDETQQRSSLDLKFPAPKIAAELFDIDALHRRLFFFVRDSIVQANAPALPAVAVDIWRYNDPWLRSLQFAQAASLPERRYLAVMSLYAPHQARILQEDSEKFILDTKTNRDILFLDRTDADPAEAQWNRAAELRTTMVDIASGKRHLLRFPLYEQVISPSGKYALLYDKTRKQFHVLNDGSIYPLQTPTDTVAGELPALYPLDFSRRWSKDEHYLLAGDGWDIWRLDMTGSEAAVCLTTGYGRKHHRMLEPVDVGSENWDVNRQLMLSIFDTQTKEQGYASVALGGIKSQLHVLKMWPVAFCSPDQLGHSAPIKAKNASVWLLMRETSTSAPNYVLSPDLKHFTPVCDVHPETQYNWYSVDLINFKGTDGTALQGLLYRPGEFQAGRRYPVICTYYERRSDGLNRYISPEGNGGDLNIPWFTSHGYIVMVPDVDYHVGEPGRDAISAIEGARRYLCRQPFIDSTRIGLQGHSFGAWATYEVITHNPYFRAAIASSGTTDIAAQYNLLWGPWNDPRPTGSSYQPYYELSQGRIGKTLFEDPGAYIRQSPIFLSGQVSTPLMIISNYADGNVPFYHGLSFFQAMRRLGKPCWMLQYDRGAHGLGGSEQIDYLLRSQQFFDYYLKGERAPKWMVEGIPVSRKGFDNSYELEPLGVEQGPSLLTPAQQLKADSISTRKSINIILP